MAENDNKNNVVKNVAVETIKHHTRKYLLAKVGIPTFFIFLIVLFFVMIFGVALISSVGGVSDLSLSGELSQLGEDEIPKEYLQYYYDAGEEYKVPWNVIAAIHKVETNFGTIDPMVSPVGAVGHMQFMKQTWVGWSAPYPSINGVGDINIPPADLVNPSIIAKYGGYGVDANKDGKADPFNAHDAVFSAGKYLQANGGSEDIRKAVFAYNHADWYVDKVLKIAESYINGTGGGGTGNYIIPVDNPIVTSPFGWRTSPLNGGTEFHRGLDFGNPFGSPIKAIADGIVIRAEYHSSWGNHVVIKHNNGYCSLYAHQSELLVRTGDKVKQGQAIGKIGSTGDSTGAHLHLEVAKSENLANDNLINPAILLGIKQ